MRDPMFVKDAKMIAIFGTRGSGKTTLARRLIAGASRVIVFDPVGEWQRMGPAMTHVGGALPMHRAATLVKLAAERWGRGFTLVWTPPLGSDKQDELDTLASTLLRMQGDYLNEIDPRKITLLVDEMNSAFPNAISNDFPFMGEVCSRGRHYGINVIGISQRPAEVSTRFRGNTEETYILPLHEPVDHDVAVKLLGREHDAALRALVPHQYLHKAGGQVTPGRNPPLEKHSAA